MVRLPSVKLPPTANERLQAWQREIDELADYAERVHAAKQRFGQRNKPDNATFRVVREFLKLMCHGVVRCVYCEDSLADQVEHTWPKDLYPEFVFVWVNYVLICGACNRHKSSRFAVFAAATGQFTDVTRSPNAPVVPPDPGQMVFIDPRRDDGLTMMTLDFVTGKFLPLGRKGSRRHQRAQYTIEILGLNTRDVLLRVRRRAYLECRAHLRAYIKRRDEGALRQELDELIGDLRAIGHPTVWAEMKRQHQWIEELKQLFAKAPEALGW